MTTQLFQTMKALEAELNELDRLGTLRDLNASETARFANVLAELENADKAYFGALKAAREAWDSRIDVSQNIKDSAEENANVTPGTAEDELYWFDVASGSADELAC